MKVLLIENDKKIATAVKRGLEAEGFNVEVAFDGQDGLWRAQDGAYDLLVLDKGGRSRTEEALQH